MRSLAEKVLSARLGETHIFAVGQAGYIIKSASGRLLAIDLYLSDCVERFEKSVGFKRLLPKILSPDELEFDVVICTHHHLDHFDVDSIPAMISNRKTKLLCSVDCEILVEQLGLDYYKSQIFYVKPTDKYRVMDFQIEFVLCDHGSAAPGSVGVYLTVNGKNIYETGDTCLRLDKVSEMPHELDVLIAPINGAYGNMNEEECSKLAEALNPNITIPCHYGMFAAHHGDVGKFYDIMNMKNLTFKLIGLGEQYSL